MENTGYVLASLLRLLWLTNIQSKCDYDWSIKRVERFVCLENLIMAMIYWWRRRSVRGKRTVCWIITVKAFKPLIRRRGIIWLAPYSDYYDPVALPSSITPTASPHLSMWSKSFSTRKTTHCKGRVNIPHRMNFRKISKGGGSPFQSKNLCCRFWEL